MNVLHYLLQQIYLGHKVALKSWSIKKCHVSYTRKFVYSTIKNQIVDFSELKIRNVNTLVGNFSVLSWNNLIVNSKIHVHFQSYKSLLQDTVPICSV